MVVSGAQHNFANMYDPIKIELANVNKILLYIRIWGVTLLVLKHAIKLGSPSLIFDIRVVRF